MSWNNIIGQNRIKSILKDIFINKRIPNAFLFHGNEGVGKDAIAIQFGKILNCDSNFQEGQIIFDSCNNCPACHKFDKFSHPNLKIVFALPRGKNETDNDSNPYEKLTAGDLTLVRDELKKKSENNYHRISITGANEIRVISIRDIRKSLSLSITNDRYRIILITNADELNTESSNSFLKILEEPPERTLFILTTSKRDNILPTILSRCQEIYFDNLSNEQIESQLMNKFNISENKSIIISQLSQGSYTKALELMDDNYNEIRNEIVDFLRIILSNKFQNMFIEIEKMLADKDRNKIQIKLILIVLWLRDIILIREELTNKIVNIDQKEILFSFSQKMSKADVIQSIDHIENAIQLLKKNVNLQLLIYNLIINLRRSILK